MKRGGIIIIILMSQYSQQVDHPVCFSLSFNFHTKTLSPLSLSHSLVEVFFTRICYVSFLSFLSVVTFLLLKTFFPSDTTFLSLSPPHLVSTGAETIFICNLSHSSSSSSSSSFLVRIFSFISQTFSQWISCRPNPALPLIPVSLLSLSVSVEPENEEDESMKCTCIIHYVT